MTFPAPFSSKWMSVSPRNFQIDFYVDPATGDDAGPGTSPGTPLASYDEAIRRVNTYDMIGVGGRVVVHFASGAYTVTEALRGIVLRGQLVLQVDGAGKLGDDGFSVVLGSTAALAGSTNQVVKSSGLTTNQYRDLTIEILTGAAAGDRRTIARNTTTDIIPTRNFSAAVATNDTYRIVDSGAVFAISGSTLIADGVGPTTTPSQLTGSADDLTGALYFINMKWGGGAGTVRLARCSAVMLGCSRIAGQAFTLSNEGTLGAGEDTMNGLCLIGPTLGAGSTTSWAGWGMSAPGGLTIQNGTLFGYITGTTLQPRDATIYMHGGAVINTTQTCVLLLDAARLTIETKSAPSVYLEVTTAACVDVTSTAAGAVLDLANTQLVATSGTLVRVRTPACATVIASTATGSAPTAGGIGLNASWGAQVALSGACGLLGASGNDITVDNGATFGAAAALGAAGASRFNTSDGSLVVRVS